MPSSIRPPVLVIMFMIGAILGVMAAFILLAFRIEGTSVAVLAPVWLSQPGRFGWWAWALGGGLLVSLGYAARQLSRD